MSKTLVAYFSASGVTAGVAKKTAEACGGDLYEIKPEVPYTSADLNWMDKKSRSTVEMNDKAARIIETFLESYDFSGKQIAVFATSGGSGLGGTEADLQAVCKGSAKWLPGRLLPGRVREAEVAAWLSEINLEKK